MSKGGRRGDIGGGDEVMLVGDKGGDFLFLTQTGEPFVADSMGPLVRSYVEKANIGKTGACHLFRHTVATLMLENGADIRFIQQLLGHEKLDTTAIYTEVSIKQLQEVHARCHPSARPQNEASIPPANQAG